MAAAVEGASTKLMFRTLVASQHNILHHFQSHQFHCKEFKTSARHIQSVPIQRLQGYHPSICFLACKSKISLWAQFKTRRDGNLVNVEWELTVQFNVILSQSGKEDPELQITTVSNLHLN